MVGPRIHSVARPSAGRRVASLSLLFGAAVLSIAAGYAAAHGLAAPALVVAGVACAVWFCRAWLSYALPAVALIGALNGLPGLDLSVLAVPGAFKSTDLIAAALLIGAVVGMARHAPADARIQSLLMLWSGVFLLYWVAVFLRTVDSGVSPGLAFNSGRDFLIFGLFLPLACGLFRDRRQAYLFCGVLATLTSIYCLTVILAALGLGPVGLTNASHTTVIGSITRVYTYMNQLIALVFLMALCFATTRTGREARYAAAVAAITGLATLLMLTRAIYFGVGAGIVVAVVLWLPSARVEMSNARRRLIGGAAVLAIAAWAGVALAPSLTEFPAVSTLTERAVTGVTDISNPGSSRVNSVAYRRGLANTMLGYLGDDWPAGLGFQHPTERYYADLPAGSLRNPDVGVFNQLLTIGLLGTLLFFAPLLGLGIVCVIRSRQPLSDENTWFWMGATAWVTYVFATVLTLGLSNTGAMLVAGAMFGLAAHFVPSAERRTAGGAS